MLKRLGAVLLSVGSVSAAVVAADQTNTPNLRIVVVKGEDAVNIIQQKTAVAPIVEVRDRNNLPIAGVPVTFAVGPGASFGGVQTVTVMTNAAGQATATGFSPTAAGALRIEATASFQGQSVAATISQSNVMTAAPAVVGGAGGLSGTTIGILGAAVGVGALVATQVGGGTTETTTSAAPAITPGSTAPTATQPTPTAPTPPPVSIPAPAPTPAPTTPTPPATVTGVYRGTVSGTYASRGSIVTPGTTNGSCATSFSVSGTLTINLETRGSDSASGVLSGNPTFVEVSRCIDRSGSLPSDGHIISYIMRPRLVDLGLADATPFQLQIGGPISGSPGSLRFSENASETGSSGTQISATLRRSMELVANMGGDAISATLTVSHQTMWTNGPTIAQQADGSGRFPVTFTKVQ